MYSTKGSKGVERTSCTIYCPRCGAAHCFADMMVDTFVNCDCGLEFYVFADGMFRITMSGREAMCESTVCAMRRFVVSTGRCTDIPAELLGHDENYDRDINMTNVSEPEYELELALEDYQLAAFGECFLTKELIDSICDSLSDGKDIELKKMKDRVDVIELKRKRVRTKKAESVMRVTTLDSGIMRSTPCKCPENQIRKDVESIGTVTAQL